MEHDCFKIIGTRTLYTDPYEISVQKEKADLIIITHEHFDHCSPKDIRKISSSESYIVASVNCKNKFSGLNIREVKYLKPGEEVSVNKVAVKAVEAYNVNKFKAPGEVFHPKDYMGIGALITLDNLRIYFAGDTDVIPEMKNFGPIDVALLPVSGTYVMTSEEAVEAVKILRPKIAIPMHYGAIVGGLTDAEKFKEKASGYCEVVILEKEK